MTYLTEMHKGVRDIA